MVTSVPISAVSPITTPLAWSMNKPGPRTAAGWMSTPVSHNVSAEHSRADSLRRRRQSQLLARYPQTACTPG